MMITENTSMDYDVHGEGPSGRWAFFKQVPSFSRHSSTITFDARPKELLGRVESVKEEILPMAEDRAS